MNQTKKIKNLSLLLAMTKNRVVAYQWVHESVSNVEIYHFWWQVLRDFPMIVRRQRMAGNLPENLQR